MFLEESSRPTITVVLKLFPNDLYFFKRKNQTNLKKEMFIMIEVNIKYWLFTITPSLKIPK
jgi:hypothetical protein